MKMLFAVLLLSMTGAYADGRAGSVQWSDGRQVAGAISLTSGKTLRLFLDKQQVTLDLDNVKQLVFTPEKEELFEGFYFPNAGQATQVKTGEVYPIRYLQTQVTLADGKVLTGHLYTTTFYIENDDRTQKLVVMAKQTGADKEKLADLVYPTLVRFDTVSPNAGKSLLDLGKIALKNPQDPVIITRPDLAFVVTQQNVGASGWTVQAADPAMLFVSVRDDAGFHIGWPAGAPNVEMKQAADAGLKTMQDFYDDRTPLGYVTDREAGEVYMLALLKRAARFVNGGGEEHDTPWSMVVLRWKYDPEQKKVTLMNRALLGIGRMDSNRPQPAVFKQPEVLANITRMKPQ